MRATVFHIAFQASLSSSFLHQRLLATDDHLPLHFAHHISNETSFVHDPFEKRGNGVIFIWSAQYLTYLFKCQPLDGASLKKNSTDPYISQADRPELESSLEQSNVSHDVDRFYVFQGSLREGKGGLSPGQPAEVKATNSKVVRDAKAMIDGHKRLHI
jgi:hypothetical protein